MRLGEVRVELNGARGGGVAVVAFPRDSQPIALRRRQQRPGLRVVRVELDRTTTQADDGVVLAHVAQHAAGVVMPGHQVEVVGIEMGRAALLDRLFFLRQQLEFQRRDDGLGDLVLQREDVVQVAVVALGPEVVVARRLDQLGGDADAPARAPHAALEHVADLQLPRDLRQVDVLALERECGVARDDGER